MPENVNTSALTIGTATTEAEDNRPVMIKVDHVSMSFNMASEQLNNLKEYAIAIAQHKLFFEELKALDDVSFEVRKGDVFGVMGTNGSGKSTVLKVIAGVLDPTSGSCTVNGNIAPLIELGAGFDMDLSARENIYLNGALLGYSRPFIDEHFDDIVEFAEVERFLDMPMKNYSSGMVSRIAFAIATVIVPEILLVDEVLSVGDFMFQKKCEDRIRQLIEEHGVTVLIVSHSNEQVARLCNKAIWIEKGHTRLQGNARMVARVYGGLGGRTGSPEAEEKVFEALARGVQADNDDKGPEYSLIRGENNASTNVKVILDAFKGSDTDTLILANDSTHINAIFGSTLAGALDAPVVPIAADLIPDAVERVLYEHRPKQLFIVDIGNSSANIAEAFEELPWKPQVVRFDAEATPFDFSRQVYEYGKDRQLWGDSVALIDFDANAESFTLAPFLYAQRCPALMMNQGEDQGESQDEELRQFFEKARPKRVVSVGAAAHKSAKALCELLEIEQVTFNDEAEGFRWIEATTFVFGQTAAKAQPSAEADADADAETDAKAETAKGEDKDDASKPKRKRAGRPLYATSQAMTQWPVLISSGAAVGKAGGALLRMDTTNLDDMARCVKFVQDNKDAISELIFIGNTALSLAERNLLAGCLV